MLSNSWKPYFIALFSKKLIHLHYFKVHVFSCPGLPYLSVLIFLWCLGCFFFFLTWIVEVLPESNYHLRGGGAWHANTWEDLLSQVNLAVVELAFERSGKWHHTGTKLLFWCLSSADCWTEALREKKKGEKRKGQTLNREMMSLLEMAGLWIRGCREITRLVPLFGLPR